tara:strand:- start:186 stop:359 length:174 start_codon:yes stop_codon:yes gene_type:complete
MTNKEYLARRYARYLSSGCVLCWDHCSSKWKKPHRIGPGKYDCPVLPTKSEKKAFLS